MITFDRLPSAGQLLLELEDAVVAAAAAVDEGARVEFPPDEDDPVEALSPPLPSPLPPAP